MNNLLSTSEFEELLSVGQPAAEASASVAKSPVSRFQVINQAEVEQFINDQENANTRKKTIHDTNLFFQFCKEQGETKPIKTLEVEHLDNLIGNFIATVKKRKWERV